MAGSFTAPDVLVLGGGGILGEVWMSGVLAGLEDISGFDARSCEGFVGTSAGSIVAAVLASGVSPGTRLRLPEMPAVEKAGGSGPGRSALDDIAAIVGRAGAPLAAAGLQVTAPGGAVLRRAALARVPDGRQSLGRLGESMAKLGATWDGRLRIATVDLATGRRVTFGAPGAPDATVAEAVLASCSIPGVFPPVQIGGRRYVDGGVWSPTNLDAAEAGRGTRVLCLTPTASLPVQRSLLGALGPLSRAATGVEAAALRQRGASVRTVVPDAEAVAAMGPNLMDPGPRGAVIEAGLRQGRRLGLA